MISYTTLVGATSPQILSIAVPATTIDIQDGGVIIQFDLSKVDIGAYQDIQNMFLRASIWTDQPTIAMQTVWNTTETSIGQVEMTQMLTLGFDRIQDNLRKIQTDYIPSIIQQLVQGNTVVYFIPEKNILTSDGTIVMELEVVQRPYEVTPKIEQEAENIQISEIEQTEQISAETGIQTAETTGVQLLETTGMQIPEAEQTKTTETNLTGITEFICEQYTTKKSCNTSL